MQVVLFLQLVGELRQARAERLQVLEPRRPGTQPDAREGLVHLAHQPGQRAARGGAHQAVQTHAKQLLLPALDGHAQAGRILERGVLDGVADAAAAGAEALGRAVDRYLAVQESLGHIRRDRSDEDGQVKRQARADVAEPARHDGAR
jgi:hypothetical protein